MRMAAVLAGPVCTFLEEPNVAILATVSPKGRPQATPIWFLLEGNHILVNTSKGRVKLRNLEQRPYATLTVVDPTNIYRWVQIQGKVHRFDTANGARDIDRLSWRYRGKPYQYPGTDGPENRVSILIEPLTVSGRPA
jgi:PPOX class probable F420-dependent enzyme